MRSPDGGTLPARQRTSLVTCRHGLVSALLCGGSPAMAPAHASAADPRPPVAFERIVIDDNFPGAYQVEVADVNGDGKPDVIAVGSGT